MNNSNQYYSIRYDMVIIDVMIFQDREPRGIIPLENLQVREVNDARRKVCNMVII